MAIAPRNEEGRVLGLGWIPLLVLEMEFKPSLALVVGLVLSVFPAVEARQADVAAGAIGQAAPRAAAEASEKRSGSDWSRVRNLKGGTEVDLIRSGSATRKRYVLRADEGGLTVLNVANPAIPAAAKNVLIRTASDHPDYFFRVQQGESVSFAARNLRLTPEGLFDGDRKVTGLEQVLENIPRQEIAEIRALSKHVGRHAKRGALIGAIVAVGLLGLACASEGCGGSGETAGVAMVAAGGAAYGVLFGAIVGGIAPRTMDVIYRAP